MYEYEYEIFEKYFIHFLVGIHISISLTNIMVTNVIINAQC